jgi:hypothetical protein
MVRHPLKGLGMQGCHIRVIDNFHFLRRCAVTAVPYGSSALLQKCLMTAVPYEGSAI